MPDRFFCTDLTSPTVTLGDAEAHHAIHVLRVAVGQTLELFDGQGTSVLAVVRQVQRRTVELEIVERGFTKPDLQTKLIIAAAAPKGDRLKWMVEKLTELGVHEYVPLVTARSVVDPRQTRLNKLQATIVTAAKQCRRDWLMNIAEPTSLTDVLNRRAASQTLHLAHPPQQLAASLAADSGAGEQSKSDLVLIGPEGGFTADEVQAAIDAGANCLSWPGHILRIETAAVMAAVWVRSRK